MSCIYVLAAANRSMAGAVAALSLMREARTPELSLEGVGFNLPRTLLCIVQEDHKVYKLSALVERAMQQGLVLPDVVALQLKVSHECSHCHANNTHCHANKCVPYPLL